jgi:hypothetical protein
LQIKILENAPRDADKLQALLKAKEREKQKAIHIEHKVWLRDSNAQACSIFGSKQKPTFLLLRFYLLKSLFESSMFTICTEL